MALRRLEEVASVFKLSVDFRKVSLLTLKLAKSVIMISVCTTSTRNSDMIRAFLRRVVCSKSTWQVRIVARTLDFMQVGVLEVCKGRAHCRSSVGAASV